MRRHERRDRERRDREDGRPAPDPQPAPIADDPLRVLQRAAGNQALSGLLRPTQPTLQRYEAGEHAQVGGEAKVMVNGIEMTQGEVNAMGDFYSSVDEMSGADRAELQKLVDLIRRDRAARTGDKSKAPVSTDEWEAATQGRYLKLAAQNRAHFAPPPGGTGLTGENHKAKYYELHRSALHQAWFDGRFNNHTVSNAARVKNAFAAHFLTDAFSAGHLINKPLVMQYAREKWDKAGTSGLILKENKLTKTVAASVLAHPKAGPKLADKELKLVVWGDVTAQRFSELLWQFAKKEPDKFFNAFARAVHDHLDNAASGKDKGVRVTNARGDGPWHLSGDATLVNSPDSLKFANAAAKAAEDNLVKAAAATSEPDYHGMTTEVWNYTPIPTAEGAEMIKHATDAIADAENDEAIAAFTALAVEEIDSAIKELMAQGYMRKKEGVEPEPVMAFP